MRKATILSLSAASAFTAGSAIAANVQIGGAVRAEEPDFVPECRITTGSSANFQFDGIAGQAGGILSTPTSIQISCDEGASLADYSLVAGTQYSSYQVYIEPEEGDSASTPALTPDTEAQELTYNDNYRAQVNIYFGTQANGNIGQNRPIQSSGAAGTCQAGTQAVDCITHTVDLSARLLGTQYYLSGEPGGGEGTTGRAPDVTGTVSMFGEPDVPDDPRGLQGQNPISSVNYTLNLIKNDVSG